MKVYVETNPETIYSGRVKDEVKTTEIRMWFETDEEIEVLSLSDYTKQVRKEVIDEIKENLLKLESNCIKQPNLYDFNCQEIIDILDQIQGKGE